MFEYVNDWSFTPNLDHSVDVIYIYIYIYIYIDFAKVIDKDVHTKLLFKLQSYDKDRIVFKWIEQVLTDRLQCIRVNGYYSNFIAVLSGVPQSSVLGPILFLIFIDDICDAVRDCSVKLFADDVKLYLDISCNNASLMLQEAITSLHSWANEWQL